jgi:formamidopyrimidine-DNA glycosylase
MNDYRRKPTILRHKGKFTLQFRNANDTNAVYFKSENLMPELPEVETIARYLNNGEIINSPVTDVAVFWARTVVGEDIDTFIRTLMHNQITSVGRRAKWLIFELQSGKHILVHLRMTGNFRITDRETPEPHDRIVLDFANGNRLHYRDTRKFGRWKIVDSTNAAFADLGPEPLSSAFTGQWLFQQLQKHRRLLKPLLLDQHFLVGLGNIYVDEALFDCGLHPQRISNQVTEKEAATLCKSIRKVLRNSIENQGTSLGDGLNNYGFSEGKRGRNQLHLKVYQRTGQPCVQCGNPIEKITVAQRSTHLCPHCQS